MTHKNPSYKDRAALAPYNFVSLPPKPHTVSGALPHDRYLTRDDEGHEIYSGCFECELTTETPFFIRGMLSTTDFAAGKEAKNRPGFFSIDDSKTPRIPGSSLRGLFRSMVEIVVSARLHAVTDQRAVFRAVDTTKLGIQYRERVQEEVQDKWFVPRVQAGYMRHWRGEWYIQPAQVINGTTWCRISHTSLGELGLLPAWPPEEVRKACDTKTTGAGRNAKTIYIQPGKFEFQEVRGGFLHIKFARALRASATPGQGLQVAALAESGQMDSKRSEAIVFAPDMTKTPENGWLPLRYPDPDQPDKEVELDRRYRDQVSPQQAALLGSINGALQDMQPVFYLAEKGQLTFFGHTLMLRLPYTHSPLQLVPEGFRADRKDDYDLAETIFGYVRKNEKGDNVAGAGNTFFSDGEFTGNLAQPFESEITPKALSGPKTTTFQHYLAQPDPDDKEQLLNYDHETHIRGRKLYWHKGAVSVNDIEERDRDKLKHATQYTRIRTVKPGATFRFKIRFDNLRAEELGALGWVLRCAADPAYRLKLGMGKPHGMGAVKITSQLRLTDRQARYQALITDADNWSTGERPHSDSHSALDNAVRTLEAKIAGSTDQFSDQPHIRELLTMLRWPGPNRELTRYMDIERRDRDGRKVNEYRYRPVLPTPTFVVQPKYLGDRAPQPQRKRDEDEHRAHPRSQPRDEQSPHPQPPPPSLPEVREQVSAEAEQMAKQLAERKIAEGDVVTAEVFRVTANDYECKLGSNIKTLGKLPRDEQKGLKVGDKVRVRVKRIAGSGAAILTVRGVPKE